MKNEYWFISFGDKHGNLGVVIVQETSAKRGLLKTTLLGINPGGEAAISRCAPDEAERLGVDRLISPREMRETHGYASTHQISPDLRRHVMAHSQFVCEHCNDSLVRAAL